MPEPVQRFELDLDDPPAEVGPRAAVGWRRVIVAAVVFVLGVAVGVGATVKQRDAAAKRERESALALTVVAAAWPNTDTGARRAQVDLRVLNSGPRPARLERAVIELPGFAPGEDSTASPVIEPGDWGHVVGWTGDADCTLGAVDTLPPPYGQNGTVMLVVRLESGEVRTVREPIESMGEFGLTDMWSQVCQPYGPDAGVWAYVSSSSDVTAVSGGFVVPAELTVEYSGDREITVTGVSGNEFIDVRTLDELGPIRTGQTVRVQLTVRECPRDDQLVDAVQMPYFLRIPLDGTESDVQVDVYQPQLTVQLVELFHRVCDKP